MSVANSYAKALYGAAVGAGAKADLLDRIEQQLDAFVAVVDSSEMARKALLAPVVGAKEKVTLIEAIAQQQGFEKIFTQFLTMLAAKRRLPAIHAIRDAFRTARLAAEGGVAGRLVSAEPLSDGDVQGLASAFTKKLGRKVAFTVSTDSNLLAGMKVSVAGVTYDGTLRAQLQSLKSRLSHGVPSN
jgi:F-type H+-transporting ATPase subunit delta